VADGRVPVGSAHDIIVLTRGEVKCENLSTDSCIVGGCETVSDATSPVTHDITVHRNYYRLPENTVEVAKVSRILIIMER
jgi:hypothetical protein